MTVDDFEPGPQLVTSAGVPGCSSTAPSAEAARFDPAWRTSTVLAIASDIMERGNFDAMPILADALQDAGCDNTTLLEHCRHGAQHNEACWALDAVMHPRGQKGIPPHAPQRTQSVFIEAVRLIGQIEDRHGEEPAWWIVVPSVFLGFVVFLLAVERLNVAVVLALPLIPALSFMVLYLLFCLRAIRNRWRRP